MLGARRFGPQSAKSRLLEAALVLIIILVIAHAPVGWIQFAAIMALLVLVTPIGKQYHVRNGKLWRKEN